MLAVSGLQAQDLLRYNYRHNGYVYTGSEKLTIADKLHPFSMRLEKIVFKDNTYAFRLQVEFTKDRNIAIPKSAKFVVTFPDGKFISSTQVSTPSSNKGLYYFEEANIKRMMEGVKTLEVVVSWDMEGYYTFNFPDGAFAKALKKQYDALMEAPVPTTELGDNISEIADRSKSRTTITKAESVKGTAASIRMSLNGIYYKTGTPREDFDLNIEVVDGQDKIFAIDTPVVFTLSDGTQLTMNQERDTYGIICCYPTASDIKKLARGTVKSIAIGSQWSISFDGRSFSRALDKQYNSLMQVSLM